MPFILCFIFFRHALYFVRQSRAHILLEEPNWQQLNDLFVFGFSVALKKRVASKVCILSCFVKLRKSFCSTFCVSLVSLSARTPAVYSVSDFIFFKVRDLNRNPYHNPSPSPKTPQEGGRKNNDNKNVNRKLERERKKNSETELAASVLKEQNTQKIKQNAFLN